MTTHAYIDSRHDHLCRCESCRPQPAEHSETCGCPECVSSVSCATNLRGAEAMIDWGVLHRCRWDVQRSRHPKQCVRRGRWIVHGNWWLCKQHYEVALKLAPPRVECFIFKGPGAQGPLLS
jgi:hypothetical protein